MKTLKWSRHNTYPMATHETFADVTENLPRFIDHKSIANSPPAPLSPRLSEPETVRGPPRPADGQISGLISVRPQGPTPRPGQFSVEIDIILTWTTLSAPFPCS